MKELMLVVQKMEGCVEGIVLLPRVGHVQVKMAVADETGQYGGLLGALGHWGTHPHTISSHQKRLEQLPAIIPLAA